MCFKFAVLALACLGGLAAQRVQFKRQVSSAVVTNPDHVPAQSGHGDPAAAVHAGSKFFQYIHVPAKDHYEHGLEGGNEHHFIERHEKAHPHGDGDGETKTKVRWGDKHGGYGEHYWDYNHGGQGHQGGEGKESRQAPEYAAYAYAPAYSQVDAAQRGKREQGLLRDVEFISDKARSLILDGNAQKHGGNYRSADDYRGKREQHKINGDDLVFKPESGTLFDRRTGRRYELKPIYSDKEFQF